MSSSLPWRVPLDSNSFLCEEKLDKWLDLRSLHTVVFDQELLDDPWQMTKLAKSIIGVENALLLKKQNIKLSDLPNCELTPCLIAIVHKVTLSGSPKLCFLRQDVARKFKDISSSAASISLSEQLKHLFCRCSNAFQKKGEGAGIFIAKLKQWHPICLSAWYVSMDFMKVLEIRKRLFSYISLRNPIDRVELRCHKWSESDKISKWPYSLELRSLNGRIFITRTICILQLQGKQYLLNEELLLELVNKTTELFNLLMYNHLISGTIMPENQLEGCISLLTHWCREVVRLGNEPREHHVLRKNQGFVYLKSMEALGVAHIIKCEDKKSGWNNPDLLDTMWTSLYDDKLVRTDFWDDSELACIFSQLTCPQIAELIGTVKVIGHPAIDVEVGLDQLYERTHAELDIDDVQVEKGIGVMCRDLCTAFFKKYKRYPKWDITSAISDELRQVLSSGHHPGADHAKQRLSNVNVLDWAKLRFEKNEEFDVVENQFRLIKDKAGSLVRSKIFKSLICGDDIPEDKEEKRILLKYLLSQSYTREYLEYIQQFEDNESYEWSYAVLNYLVIKLTAKELEMKPSGRFFGGSPGFERNRRAVFDYNVMRLMDKFVGDQLMTPGELKVINKLLSFRKFATLYPGKLLFQVSFDFSKWNNNMRAESIDIPAARVLDAWFGRKLYGKTMKAFENTLFYYKDKVFTKFWQGQAGGIEGLAQATWSFVFLSGIKAALEELQLPFQITVKGDDVRVVLAVDPSTVEQFGHNYVRDQILNQLKDLCAKMGWQLNPQESFVSITLIATSKQYQVRDTWLPATSKKIMKLSSLSNLLFPTTEDIVASIFSNAHSSTSQSTGVLPTFALASLIGAMELYRAMPHINNDVHRLVALLVWPQVLGGPGALPLQTFILRGENDMLSVSLSLIRHIMTQSESEELRVFMHKILGQEIANRSDFKLLLSDPYAINLNLPVRPASVLRNLLRNHLRTWVKHPEIRLLLSSNTEREEKQFIDYLVSARPYYSKVLTVIWECSPFYLIEELLSKFLASSSLIAMFAAGQGPGSKKGNIHSALRKVLAAHKKRLMYWKTLLESSRTPDVLLGIEYDIWLDFDGRCTTELVHMIRESIWGFDIQGITYPSLVEQNFFAIGGQHNGMDDRWTKQGMFVKTYTNIDAAIQQTCLDSHHYSSAPNVNIWVGSNTRLKVDIPDLDTSVTSPTLAKITKLLTLCRITDAMGPEVKAIIIECLKTLTSVDIRKVITLVPETGQHGHVSHRVSIISYSPETMLNFRPNICQLCHVDTDGCTLLKADSFDRTINFAGRHFFILFMVMFDLQYQQTYPKESSKVHEICIHWDTRKDHYDLCPYCAAIVTEDQIIEFEEQVPDLSIFHELGILSCSETEEQILERSVKEFAKVRQARTIGTDIVFTDDRRLQSTASMVLLAKSLRESDNIFLAAQSSNIARNPTSADIEKFGTLLGVDTSSSISFNDLRRIQPDVLYMALTDAVTNWIMDNIGKISPEEGGEAWWLTKLESTSLGQLFHSLISASCLMNINRGRSIVYPDKPPLVWSVNAMKKGDVAAREFINAHYSDINNVLSGKAERNRPLIYLSLEASDAIIESLRSKYRRLYESIIHIICSEGLIGNALSFARDQIDIFLQNPFIVLEMMEDPRDYRWVWFIRIVCVFDMLASVRFNSFVDEDTFNSVEMKEHSLFVTDWFQYTIPTWDELGTELPEVQTYLTKYISRELYGKMTLLCTDFCSKVDETPEFPAAVIYQRSFQKLQQICNNLSTIVVYPMTKETASRVIRANEHLEVYKRFKEFTSDIDWVMQNKMLAGTYPFVTKGFCEMGENEHEDLRSDGDLSLVEDDGSLHGFAFEPTDMQMLGAQYVDLTNIARCVGDLNTSASKFAECFGRLNVHRRRRDPSKHYTNITLADGIGGVAAFLLRKFPNDVVIYCSLLPSPGRKVGDSSNLYPPLEVWNNIYLSPAPTDRICWEGTYPGDLSLKEVQDHVIQEWRDRRLPTRVITMDADINWSSGIESYEKLLNGCLRIIMLTANIDTLVIFKTFLVKHIVIKRFIYKFTNLFMHSHIYRPSSTRQHSCEVLLIGHGGTRLPYSNEETESYLNSPKVPNLSFAMKLMMQTVIGRISTKLVQYRSNGVLMNYPPIISDTMQLMIRGGGYPLNIKKLGDQLVDGLITASECAHKSPLAIIERTTRQIGILKSKIKMRNGSKGILESTVSSRSQFSGTHHYTRRVLCDLYRYNTLKRICSENTLIVHWNAELHDIIYRRSLYDLANSIHDYGIDKYYRVSRIQSSWYLVGPYSCDNIGQWYKHASQKMFQWLGTISYFYLVRASNEQLFEDYVRLNFANDFFRDCCEAPSLMMLRDITYPRQSYQLQACGGDREITVLQSSVQEKEKLETLDPDLVDHLGPNFFGTDLGIS